MIEALCHACGSATEAPAPLRRCPNCGHVDRSELISSGVVVNEAPSAASERETPLERMQVRIASRVLSEGCVLIDFGASNGGFLRLALQQLGLDKRSYGVETSTVNAEVAHARQLRIEPVLKDVPTGSLLTFWHSAEHLHLDELKAVLQHAVSASSGDLHVMISVPNGESLQARFFRSRWAYDDPLHHASIFTPRSLHAVAESVGLRLVRWHRTPLYGLFGAVQSSLNLVRPHNQLYEHLKRGANDLRTRDWMLSAVAGMATVPVMLTVAPAELRGLSAAVITGEFRAGT